MLSMLPHHLRRIDRSRPRIVIGKFFGGSVWMRSDWISAAFPFRARYRYRCCCDPDRNTCCSCYVAWPGGFRWCSTRTHWCRILLRVVLRRVCVGDPLVCLCFDVLDEMIRSLTPHQASTDRTSHRPVSNDSALVPASFWDWHVLVLLAAWSRCCNLRYRLDDPKEHDEPWRSRSLSCRRSRLTRGLMLCAAVPLVWPFAGFCQNFWQQRKKETSLPEVWYRLHPHHRMECCPWLACRKLPSSALAGDFLLLHQGKSPSTYPAPLFPFVS